MTRTTRPARVVRRVVQLTLVLLGVLLVGAGPSSASPTIPGVPDCKDAPAPQRPGDGLPGFLDPPPDRPAPPADPFTQNPTTSIYEQYGYAGLTWRTYDLGCAGSLGDPGATADTMIGNLTLSAATGGVAVANGVHARVAHPQTYLAPLDAVVANVSDRIKVAVWGPWGGVALLGVVALLLWYSNSGQLSTVTRAAAWALLVLTVLSGVTQYPNRVAGFFDDAVTTTIGQVNAATAGLTNLSSTSDPAHAQGSLLVDRILYEAWLRGELGSSESTAARRWGPTLFKSTAFNYDEARQAQDPQRARALTEQKNQTFKDTADRIQREDPSAYVALQGKTNSRGGVGLMALFAMLFTTLFRIVADIFMFAGLVMLRFLVMFFPAVAVLGVMSPMSAIVHRVANMAGAAVVNVVSFAAGSAVHTTVISALLAQADTPGMGLLALVLCLVTTVVAFILLLPLLSLTNIVGLSSGQRGIHALRRARRLGTRYAVTRMAVNDGEDDARSDGAQASVDGPPLPDGPRPNQKKRSRAYPAPETFSRPESFAVATPVVVGGPSRPAQSEGTSGRHRATSAGARAAAPGPDPVFAAKRTPEMQAREQAHLPSPSGASLGGPGADEVPVVEGVIVDHGAGPRAPNRRIHDSQTQVRSEGIGARLFDPATKKDVRVDDTGSLLAEQDEP